MAEAPVGGSAFEDPFVDDSARRLLGRRYRSGEDLTGEDIAGARLGEVAEVIIVE